MVLISETIRTYDGRTHTAHRCTIKSSNRLWGRPPKYHGDYDKHYKASDEAKQEAVMLLFGIGGQSVTLKRSDIEADADGNYTYIFEYEIYTE